MFQYCALDSDSNRKAESEVPRCEIVCGACLELSGRSSDSDCGVCDSFASYDGVCAVVVVIVVYCVREGKETKSGTNKNSSNATILAYLFNRFLIPKISVRLTMKVMVCNKCRNTQIHRLRHESGEGRSGRFRVPED